MNRTSKAKRPDNSQVLDTPGPGQYNIPTKIDEGAKISLGGKIHFYRTSGNPGPGAYKDNSSFVKKTSPGFSLGKDDRRIDKVKGSTAPGPGEYGCTIGQLGKYGSGFG